MSSEHILMSIIIPVHNASKYIGFLSKSLINQSLNNNLFEVILVDNLSTDGSASKLASLLKDNGVISKQIAFNDFPSSYASRNIGVQYSRGEILVFTDSDCEPNRFWLERIKNAISSNHIVSGCVDLQIYDEENCWELFDKEAHMRNDKSESYYSIATANMAVYKDDFLKVGYFHELTSGGDYAWSRTAKKLGLEIKYCPDVIVYHPTRKTYAEIEKKMLRITKGYAEISSGNLLRYLKGLLLTLIKVPLLPRDTNIRQPGLWRYIKFRLDFTKIRFKQLWVYIYYARPFSSLSARQSS